jgi:ribonuclease VapC
LIVVDTSALFAIVLQEPEGPSCRAMLEMESLVLISAGTLAEAFVAAQRRKLGEALSIVVEDLQLQVEPVTVDEARRLGLAYARWGKGLNPARRTSATASLMPWRRNAI